MEFEDFGEDFDDAVVNELAALEKLDETTQPGPHHLQVLSKYFGHESFRPLQWKIVSSIIEQKRDVCAIMATGYGKSLCFQYPSVYLGGITLVISPLISLMEDQVLSLQVSNIPACLLGTAQKKQADVIRGIFNDEYRLVYLTPEFCTGDYGGDILARMSKELSMVLIAIDEAHCISSWGHDFRVHYRKLSVLRNTFPGIPIMAVTATATPQVRTDIVRSLNLKNPLEVCSGFDRPNLYFEVFMKSSGDVLKDLKSVMVNDKSGLKFDGPTIIYCLTRKQSESVAEQLRISGTDCKIYHAGLSLQSRKEAHELFVRDKIGLIVATIAFGMGIDKPDIRNVIHYGCSKSIENYYQEVGRAGRDGAPSRCVTFYSSADFVTIRMLEQKSLDAFQNKTSLKTIEDFVTTRDCRRKFILRHFGEKMEADEKPKPKCCDNCTKKLFDKRSDSDIYEGINESGQYNFSSDALNWLGTVSVLGQGFGIGRYVMFLKGSKNSKIPQRLHTHRLFGCGSGRTEDWWKAIGSLLIKEGYLTETLQRSAQGFKYSVVQFSTKGRNLFSNLQNKQTELLIAPPPAILKSLKKKAQKSSGWLLSKPEPIQPSPSTSKLPEEEEESETDLSERMILYRKLMTERTNIASELDCMPYMVAPNATLMTLSRRKPRTLDDIRNLNLEGFTEAKLLKFGPRFLKIIGPTADNANKKMSIKNVLDKHPVPNFSLGFSAGTSLTMLAAGLSVDEIAQKRAVTVGTATSHLTSGIKAGYPIKMSDLGVTGEQRDVIIGAFRKFYPTGYEDITLTRMKNECPEDITYSQINTVLSYLQVRHHLETLNVEYEEFEDFAFDEVSQVFASNSDDTLDDLLEDKEIDLVSDKKCEMDVSGEPPPKREKREADSRVLQAVNEEDGGQNATSKKCFNKEAPEFDDDDAFSAILLDLLDDAKNREEEDPVVPSKSQEVKMLSDNYEVKVENNVVKNVNMQPGKQKALPPWLSKKKIK